MKRIRKPDPRDGWYEIPPQVADEILRLVKLNRAVVTPHVDAIAEDVRRGRWKENGESLVFDEDGILLDGQHRLLGCKAADRPIVCYCVFGVKRSAFDTIDTGKGRGGAAIASILQMKNYKVCATAADWCIKYDAMKPLGRFPSGKAARISNSDRQKFLTKNRDLIETAAHAVVTNQKHLRRLTAGPNVFAGALSIISQVDSEAAEKWFALVATGEGLSGEHPAMALRNRLIDLKSMKYKASQTDILALCLKSFCCFRDGRRVKLLKFGSGETFRKSVV